MHAIIGFKSYTSIRTTESIPTRKFISHMDSEDENDDESVDGDNFTDITMIKVNLERSSRHMNYIRFFMFGLIFVNFLSTLLITIAIIPL